MPTDGRTQTYGFLDQLSTEQLLNLLRADFDSSEDGDDEQIFQILEVIEKRERECAPDSLPDAAQAWEDFQTYFNTPDGTGRSLYPMRDSAGKSAAGTAQTQTAFEAAAAPVRDRSGFDRLLHGYGPGNRL